MKTQSGFSLIEVLVSIVILSVALLGTAGLMGASMRNTNTAYMRSQATVLADDYLDRMRANVSDAIAGRYNVDLGPSCGSGGGLAGWDCAEWTTNVTNTLPGGDAEVRVTNTGVVTVQINWGDDADGNANSFVTQSRL